MPESDCRTPGGGRDFDHRDPCEIDRIGLAASRETANPARAGFPDVAFDDGAGVEEIGGGHVTAARG